MEKSSTPHSSLLARLGTSAIDAVRGIFRISAVSAAVAIQSLRIRSGWGRTVRQATVEQIYRMGIGALPMILGVGFLVGTLVVAQYETWVGQVIESKYLATLLVVVIVRQIAPVLVNILLTARSGSAIASELGLMSALGEVHSLDAQGLDTLSYLIQPRVVAMVVASLCLTVFFLLSAWVGAAVCGDWTGAKSGSPIELLQQILLRIQARDIPVVLVKASIPPWVGATICCVEGLKAERNVVAVPRQTALAVQRAMIVVVFITSVVSWSSGV